MPIVAWISASILGLAISYGVALFARSLRRDFIDSDRIDKLERVIRASSDSADAQHASVSIKEFTNYIAVSVDKPHWKDTDDSSHGGSLREAFD